MLTSLAAPAIVRPAPGNLNPANQTVAHAARFAGALVNHQERSETSGRPFDVGECVDRRAARLDGQCEDALDG